MASTCGYDASGASRVAAPGFDCRVDTARGLWGFCPTTVILPSDCGLAGYCVDNFACSGGCGPLANNPTITTFTCSQSSACSTLVSKNAAGVLFDYIACGAEGAVQTLFATPPPVSPSTTPSAPITSTSTKSSTDTSRVTSTSRPLTSTTNENAPITSAVSSTPTNQTDSNVSHKSSPPTGAIIGGILGGLAIICITVLGIFLIRRKKAASRSSPSSTPLGPIQSRISFQDKRGGFSELGDRNDKYPQKTREGKDAFGVFEASANREPVELPGR